MDLFLFEQGGDLQSQVPAWINILPENRVTRALMLEIRFYFKDLLREKKISAAIARLRISIDAFLRSRLHRRRAFSWRVISDYMEPLDKHYDTAIAFLEFWTTTLAPGSCPRKFHIMFVLTGSLRSRRRAEMPWYGRSRSLRAAWK